MANYPYLYIKKFNKYFITYLIFEGEPTALYYNSDPINIHILTYLDESAAVCSHLKPLNKFIFAK